MPSMVTMLIQTEEGFLIELHIHMIAKVHAFVPFESPCQFDFPTTKPYKVLLTTFFKVIYCFKCLPKDAILTLFALKAMELIEKT